MMSWFSKVVWSEGLFLRPHHLQQHDRYFERLIENRSRYVTPYPWGFSDLEIDRDQARQPCRPFQPSEQDHLRVELLWQRLKGCTEAKRRLLVEGARSYQDWLLAVRICRESEKAAADKPPEAVKL